MESRGASFLELGVERTLNDFVADDDGSVRFESPPGKQHVLKKIKATEIKNKDQQQHQGQQQQEQLQQQEVGPTWIKK